LRNLVRLFYNKFKGHEQGKDKIRRNQNKFNGHMCKAKDSKIKKPLKFEAKPKKTLK